MMKWPRLSYKNVGDSALTIGKEGGANLIPRVRRDNRDSGMTA